MKIIVDAMGGDNAPLEIVKGALQGRARWGVDIVLTGDAAQILRALEECGEKTVPQGVEIANATQTVEMCDDPATVFRHKKDTSMGVGLTMLRDGKADALVSAGSTGALLTGATLITKRVRGIRRAAMAPVIPTTTGRAVLIDCGANAECTPEYLVQFAYLGNFYAKRVLGIGTPRVGLLNIGAEDSKGTDLQKQTLVRLREADAAGHLHFIGNIEAKEAIKGGCDVIVTDGFSGNILLKTMEGVGSFAGSALKGMFKKNLLTKLAALAVMPGLRDFKAQLDPNKVGGTAFIGISKPVIKAHGASNAEAIENRRSSLRRAVSSPTLRRTSTSCAWKRNNFTEKGIDSGMALPYYFSRQCPKGGECLMTTEDIFKTMQDLIAEQFAIDADEITMDSSFVDDLGADSVDLVELVMAMEEEFDIGEIEEEDLTGLKTVGDCVKYLTNKINN